MTLVNISQALRVDRNARIAFVGAGGKTTSMFRAARQYGGKILVSATAHIGVNQLQLADTVFKVTSVGAIDAVERNLGEGINLIIGPEGPAGRLQGLDTQAILRTKDIADRSQLPLLIEADGARMLPLKAPAAHEPPIPRWVDGVLVVAGLSAIGKPLNEKNVFRPELFSELAGTQLGSKISVDQICNVLLHPRGGLKNIPDKAEKIVLLNQADAYSLRSADIFAIKNKLLNQYRSIIVASMQNEGVEVLTRHEKIAGVILAAGQSERFGAPKQLLEWKGKPFIRQIAETAIAGGLDPVVVVLGAVVEPIIKTLEGLNVEIVINQDWKRGLSTSIRIGVKQIENRCEGASFLMGDMPQIPAELIRKMLEFQSKNDYYILVPRVNGHQTNPSMFDARCFELLKSLTGDVGGRQLFERFLVTWMDLDDPGLLLDVDTPNDYLLMKKLHTYNDEY